jgi:outer membrane protein OmpA-like peptidoglycan-associated protein
VVEEKSGFNWLWLLPLLLIPLFLLYKSCNKPKAEVSVVPVEEVQKTVDPEPTVAVAPDCNLNWIFFDFDKYNVRNDADTELKQMAKILKDNPTYKGVLKAFTDAKGSNEYNQRLSENRANASKQNLVAAGIDASRITTTASSESAPIATNTEDDAGRKYNRRVELFILDANGKEVCKSIPPAVPQNLKQ